MKVMGQEFVYHQAVTELTIYSEFPGKSGLAGWLEKLIQPLVVKPIYRKELRNIAAYFQKKAAA
jgi:hypothetical protein